MSGPKPVFRPTHGGDDQRPVCVICRHSIRASEPHTRISRPVTGPAHEGCARKAERDATKEET